jgi:hypothetical protein
MPISFMMFEISVVKKNCIQFKLFISYVLSINYKPSLRRQPLSGYYVTLFSFFNASLMIMFAKGRVVFLDAIAA